MEQLNNRYVVGGSIGSGGMSEVYEARDTLLGRPVAIKVLKLDMARDDNFRERFRREAHNSAKLNHPNIVAVYDTGETLVEGISVPYIVMEIVQGRTLRDIVRTDGPLSPTDAARWLVPVCDALQSSHDAGIIHRDVKPANIMVDSTGKVKVMDFGIARALGDGTGGMTQTSAVIGTAHYLSPEQARGKSADARSDVYALGCVLFELVTGQPPFEGETPFSVAYQHVQEDPPHPSSLVPGLSSKEALNLDAVVLTAMAKHPADRYDSCRDMGEDLRRLASGTLTQAAASYVEPTTAAPAAAAPSAPAYPENWQSDTVTTSAVAPAAEAPAEGRSSPRLLLAILLVIVLVLGGTFYFFRDSLRGNSGSQGTQIEVATVKVPDVMGWREEDAIRELEALGLTVERREAPSPTAARGTVMSLNPAVGSELQPGTTIEMTISTGRELTDVPNVVGMTPQEAADALNEAGLRLNQEVREEHSDTIPAGHITEQSPVAGSQISKGTEVTITVSKGQEMVKVPSLSNMPINEAVSILTSLGLTPNVVEEDSTRPAGTVVRIEDSQAEVPRNSTVTVVSSNGMLFTMPNITRMSPADAAAALRAAGWRGSDAQLIQGEIVKTGAISDSGLIATSTPASGATHRVDQPVQIRLWNFDLGTRIGDAITP